MTPAVILTDIEGTTTAIDFVHRVLFPYAHSHLEAYIARHADDPIVQVLVNDAACTVEEETGQRPEQQEVVRYLLQWIEADRKHTALKTLQGMIWEEGYRLGHFTAHLYPDVAPRLRQWHSQGMRLAVYSSGSVQAQKLLFGHTELGDLTPLFSAYFDTHVGHKREAKSYETIAAQLQVPPAHILFLSDVTEELDAAENAGMRTIQLLRPGTTAGQHHATAATFDNIVL